MRRAEVIKRAVLWSLAAAAGTGFVALTLYDIGYLWGFLLFGVTFLTTAAFLLWVRFLEKVDASGEPERPKSLPGSYFAGFVVVLVSLLVCEGLSYGLYYPQSHYYRVSITRDADNHAELVAIETAERLDYSGILDWGEAANDIGRTAWQRSFPMYLDWNATRKYCTQVWHARERQERGAFSLHYTARVVAVHELNLSFQYASAFFNAPSNHIPKRATPSFAVWDQAGQSFRNWSANTDLSVDIHFGYLVKIRLEFYIDPAAGQGCSIVHDQFVLMESAGSVRCIAQFSWFSPH